MNLKFLACGAVAALVVFSGCNKDGAESGSRVECGGLSVERLGSGNPEEFKIPGAPGGWMMKMAETGDDAAVNVNWLKETVAADLSIDDYLKISMRQYEQMNAEVLSKKIVAENEAQTLVAVNMMGSRVRCFQRILKSGRTFYVVTGTAVESRWDEVGERVMACVRSARVK